MRAVDTTAASCSWSRQPKQKLPILALGIDIVCGDADEYVALVGAEIRVILQQRLHQIFCDQLLPYPVHILRAGLDAG
ncbi:MAG TPA: hypothetical protein VJW20_18810 [Candidatus Angelobacter sp.]|nr:hypothetical protein [Candidatus Angelobacter sp.]